jgi:hypothetical protein
MNIELGVLHDGGVMLVSDQPLPDIVCRVEYYRDQRLFMLIYDHTDPDGELMHYEVPPQMARSVESTPNVIIYSLFPNHEPIGYKVPLVQIGGTF